MNKRVNIGFLFFLLPIFFFLFIDFSREVDIWFLLSHGKYVISNGFPHVEFLTIHSGFHFVMQQWGFSMLLYFFYSILGDLGVIGFLFFITIGILFFSYKICMILSDGNTYFSALISSISLLLLEFNYIVPRPQVFTYLLFIIEIYLLERRFKKKTDKGIYVLPFLSIFLINIHASMWPIFLILIIPYLIESFVLFCAKKESTFLLLLFIFALGILCGFLNPYGLEAMTYSFHSYGIKLINQLVGEMHSVSFTGESFVTYNSILFVLVLLIEVILIFPNRKKYPIRCYFLFIGLAFMSFLNLRNIALFYLIIIPFSAIGIKSRKNTSISIFIPLFCLILLTFIFLFRLFKGAYVLEDLNMSSVVSYLDKHYDKNIRIFNHFDNGPYLEYHQYHPYIDTRAEVFLKSNNHKKDVLSEYYHVLKGDISYSKFIQEYSFTHFITYKNTSIYKYLISHSSEYSIIYKKGDIVLFLKK